MSYGYLNKQQAECLIPYIRGKVVYDLGSGDFELSNELVRLGAANVIAIDRDNYTAYRSQSVAFRCQRFEAMDEDIDVALVSWPVNWECGLIEVLKRSRIIIYLGKNTDGSSCGTPDMFLYLLTRKIEQHIPSRRNTLICYSGPSEDQRYPLLEEEAAIKSGSGPVIPYCNPRCQSGFGFERCSAECYEHPEMGILCVCKEHFDAIERGEIKAPPLRRSRDYCSVGRKTFLVTDLPASESSDGSPSGMGDDERDRIIGMAIGLAILELQPK